MQRKRDWPGEEADIAMVGFLTYGEKNTFYMKEPASAHRCQLLGEVGTKILHLNLHRSTPKRWWCWKSKINSYSGECLQGEL